MLSKEERREKALKHFVSTWGERQGTKMWEDYCKKSGLLETRKPKKTEEPEKAKKENG